MSADFRQLEWDAAIEDDLRQLIRLAVREDLAQQNDWTTVALVDAEQQGRAVLVAREAGIAAGIKAAPIVIDAMQANIRWQPATHDGDAVTAGTVLAEIAGSARDLLTCERALLNLIGRLSGVATLTRQYVQQIAGTKARIYDTRKTIPGWRRVEKYAVRCGGGMNHRTGLFDGLLIKDNHLSLCAVRNVSPAEAVHRAREFVRQAVATGIAEPMPIEIEIDQLAQLNDVLVARPDLILLDNMSPTALREAVVQRNTTASDVQLEASGGVTLETVREIAETGVDRISVGALTHAARSLDVALDWRIDGNARCRFST
jgi:nicotinate-nucleotide pyrophosphorylase (carboxylating)